MSSRRPRRSATATRVIVRRGCAGLAATAREATARKVVQVCAGDDALAPPLPQPRVDVLAQAVDEGDYDTVLFGQTRFSLPTSPAVSRRASTPGSTGISSMSRFEDGELVGKRPALQDTVYADVGWTSTPRLALFRSGSFDPTESGGERRRARSQTSRSSYATTRPR